jgi:hypothetical protein
MNVKKALIIAGVVLAILDVAIVVMVVMARRGG